MFLNVTVYLCFKKSIVIKHYFSVGLFVLFNSSEMPLLTGVCVDIIQEAHSVIDCFNLETKCNLPLTEALTLCVDSIGSENVN